MTINLQPRVVSSKIIAFDIELRISLLSPLVTHLCLLLFHIFFLELALLSLFDDGTREVKLLNARRD
jgi:hypothetical protein